LTGHIAGQLAPRGPGRTPTRLATQLIGKISQNVMWKRNFFQWLLTLPQSVQQRLLTEIKEAKGYYAR